MHRPGVVALVIGGFGLAVLAIVVSSLREAAAMKRWPVAEGRVLSAKVEDTARVSAVEPEALGTA